MSLDDLPAELRDLIMARVHVEDDVVALYLAMTCKGEIARYLRVIPRDERITYRSLVVDRAYEEGVVTYNNQREEVVVGEPGYAYFKKKEEKEWHTLERREWKRPKALYKKAAAEKARRYDKAQWRKKNFE